MFGQQWLDFVIANGVATPRSEPMDGVNSDVAYDYIRRRILDGTYAAGAPLTASVLAEEIGVSRTPVREALRQLEAEGLVAIRPHFGASVRTLDFKDFKEMCGMRLALESYAAAYAASNWSDSDIQEIGLALASMRRITQEILADGETESRRNEMIQEDIRFHIAILAGARNELIKKSILQLHLINRIVSAAVAMKEPQGLLATVTNRREVLEEHAAIYQAVLQRDAEAARRAMERHIQTIIDKQIAMRARGSTAPVHAKALSKEELLYTP